VKITYCKRSCVTRTIEVIEVRNFLKKLVLYNSQFNLQVRYFVLVLYSVELRDVYSAANVVKGCTAYEIGAKNTISFRLRDLGYDPF
jgi:hypothetical protein